MGKRVQGQAFLNGVIDHGAHFCTYLLGTDMEMNTPDGFQLMNWETGYGDWIADARSGTPCASCPGSRRRPSSSSDTIDEETHEEIPVSPRTILKRQVARGRGAGLRDQGRLRVRVLRAHATPTRTSTARASRSPSGSATTTRTTTCSRRPRPSRSTGSLRNLMTEARIPIEFSKGEAAPGQHEVNIRYDHVLESADRSVLFKHGAKEIAWLNGWGLTFMAKPDHDLDRLVGPPAHERSGTRDGDDAADLRREGASAVRHVRDDAPLPGRDDEARRASWPIFFAPNINSYKRYAVASWAPVNVVWGRDNRTTGFRVVGHGPALHVE